MACPQNRDPRQGLALDTALGSAQGTQLGVGSVKPRWAQSRVPVCVSQYSGGLRQQWNWACLAPEAGLAQGPFSRPVAGHCEGMM